MATYNHNYKHIYIYIYIYIHTCIHIYIYIYIHHSEFAWHKRTDQTCAWLNPIRPRLATIPRAEQTAAAAAAAAVAVAAAAGAGQCGQPQGQLSLEFEAYPVSGPLKQQSPENKCYNKHTGAATEPVMTTDNGMAPFLDHSLHAMRPFQH